MCGKIKKLSMGLAALALGVGLIAVGVSCNSEDDDNVTLTPDQVTITGSQSTSVVFTVTGGVSPFAWIIAAPENGSLVIGGNRAIYTSVAGHGANFITVVDDNGESDEAQVLQNP